MVAHIKRHVEIETEYAYAEIQEKEALTQLDSLRRKLMLNSELDEVSSKISAATLSATDNPLICPAFIYR